MLRFSHIISLLLFAAIAVNAQNVCEMVIGSGDSKALLTVESDSQNRVVVYIGAADGGDESQTSFRAAGLDPTGWKFDGHPMSEYFTQSPSSAGGQKRVLFTPIEEDSVAQMLGRPITFNMYGENVYCEWRTSGNANAYSQAVRFTYTYGISYQQLPTPAITSIDADGHITFMEVDHASAYTANVYLGSVLKYQQSIASGQVLNFTPYVSADYSVTLTAFASGYKHSDESAPYSWSLVSAPLTIGGSEYCEAAIGSGNSTAEITWGTLDNGDVEIMLSGDANTAFRANAMGASLSGFRVSGGPANSYFTKQYSSGSNRYILHLNDPTIRPAHGERISFNGTVEWKTMNNTNAYSTLSFNYTYGAVCSLLIAPQITQITADSVVIFTPVEGASEYIARVYLNGVFKYQQPVQPGGVLHFTPFESGTYDVTLTASGSGCFTSDESAPYAWTLAGHEAVIENSEYCNLPIGHGYSRAWFTWQTLQNGDVEISISGDAATSFRANGFAASGFRVGNMPASAYFDVQYDGTGATTYTLHLRDSLARPSVGQVISFRGTVEWRTANNNNAYDTNLSFSYTYGSVCPQLQTPVIESIDEDNAIYIENEDPQANYYTIYIYRGELLVHTENLFSRDQITFIPTASGTYLVYVQAISQGNGMVSSDLSEPYTWVLRGTEQDLGRSEVCQKYVSGDDGGVYLTAETDVDGQIVFTISGTAHPVWRANGIGLEGMTIGSSPIANYFRTYGAFVGDSTYILRPTSAGLGVFFPGDVINFTGTLEWSVVSASGAAVGRYVTNYKFTYTYGTSCTELLPRLQMPRNLRVSEAGVTTFSEVEHASTYEIKVLDEESDEMVQQSIMNGEIIDRKLAVFNPFAYYVSIRAVPDDISLYRPSLWSDAVKWLPDYQPIPEPETPDVDPEYSDIEQLPVNGSCKYMIDGQLYILRDGHIFTILGTLVK